MEPCPHGLLHCIWGSGHTLLLTDTLLLTGTLLLTDTLLLTVRRVRAPCPYVSVLQVAFVTTVHVADDPNGEGFGLAHYTVGNEKRLVSSRGDDCVYGPRESCTIDTNRPFTARFSFSAEGTPFEYTVTLEQEDGARVATLPSPVRYVNKPGKGTTGSADAANALLRGHLDSGMTLVVSYWAGKDAHEMAWLDMPCTGGECPRGSH